LFAHAWAYHPEHNADELVSRALEATITFDERLERLKANGLAAAMAKKTTSQPAKAKRSRR
jgi:hypothetical protein